MNIKIKVGRSHRIKVYLNGELQYVEIKRVSNSRYSAKVYSYKISHSRDLRKTHTKSDRK